MQTELQLILFFPMSCSKMGAALTSLLRERGGKEKDGEQGTRGKGGGEID